MNLLTKAEKMGFNMAAPVFIVNTTDVLEILDTMYTEEEVESLDVLTVLGNVRSLLRQMIDVDLLIRENM